MNLSKIAAIVIWYNPSLEHATNISTYINDVGRLFVVDNSSHPNGQCVDWLAQYENVQYVELAENKGIAYALNRGAQLAYEQGFEWILTMDQDSAFSSDVMGVMFDVLSLVDQPEKIGILTAVPSCSILHGALPSEKWSLVQTAFTSGNLVRTQAWYNAAGWNDALFIDSVDYDFDFRVQRAGYLVVRCNNAIFEHQLGELRALVLFGKQFFVATNHNYIRRYYITRNRLYINNKYRAEFPLFVRSERFANLKDFIKIIIFEKDKLRKFQSMFRGYCDYKNNIMGKYRW